MSCKHFDSSCLDCPYPDCIIVDQAVSESHICATSPKEYQRQWKRRKRLKELQAEFPFLEFN